MDILEKVQSNPPVKKKRSDWCKALSYYSTEQKICQNCFALKSQLGNFLLPLKTASQKLEGVDLLAFELAMHQVGKPIIFTNNTISTPKSFLVYYLHGINFSQLPSSLSISLEESKPCATIISPEYYSKSKRTFETKVVRDIQHYFNPTAFIKLPLYEMDELMNYAASERCEMLILPMNKLAQYLEVVVKNPEMKIVPAAFFPINNP